MACPKCGEPLVAGAVICQRCDFIIDTSFLGDDILDELRDGNASGCARGTSSSSDALVIGALGEEMDMMELSDATGGFLTANTVEVDRRLISAPAYVSRSVQELMRPEAVLAPAPDVDKRRGALSPFELHVLGFIDGKRPVARVRKLAGLTSDDVRIAVGMLADKGAVVLAGAVAPPSVRALLEHELKDELSDEQTDEQSTAHAVSRAPLEVGDDEHTRVDASADVSAGRPPAAGRAHKPVFPLDDVALAVPAPAREAPPPWDVRRSVPQAPQAPQAPEAPEARAAQEARPPAAVPVPAAAPRTPAAPPRASTPAPRQPHPPTWRATREEQAATFFELAHDELKKGNRSKAHVYARLAADADPSEPKYAELLKSWGTAVKAAVSQDARLFAEADAAEKAGSHPKALLLFQQAVAVNPNAAHLHNRIGLLLAVRFKRFSEASESLMKACELEPNNVVFKNNLGKIIALAQDRDSGVASGKQGGLLGKLKKAFE